MTTIADQITGLRHNPRAFENALRATRRAADWELIEAAEETLLALDEMAELMMQGKKCFKTEGVGPINRTCEFSLAASDYTGKVEYNNIEAEMARSTGDTAATFRAAKALQNLMFKCCREEAARFINVEIDEMKKHAQGKFDQTDVA